LGLYGLMYHISQDRSCPTHCKCMEALFRPVFLCSRPANLAVHEYYRCRVVSSSGSQSAIDGNSCPWFSALPEAIANPLQRHELALLGTPRCQTGPRDVLVIGPIHKPETLCRALCKTQTNPLSLSSNTSGKFQRMRLDSNTSAVLGAPIHRKPECLAGQFAAFLYR
jgi:hypothetical protein